MKEVLIERKGLNMQVSVWIGKGGGSSVVAIPLGDVQGQQNSTLALVFILLSLQAHYSITS